MEPAENFIPSTFTPDYLHEIYNRPRSPTTYGSMNDWHNTPRGPQGVPVTQSDYNWQGPDCQTEKKRSKPIEDPYRKAYNDLKEKVAYRHPNPGLPKIRQGAIGGNWRHIKEVLGHGGGRVIFVDDCNPKGRPAVFSDGRRRVGGNWDNVRHSYTDGAENMLCVDDGIPKPSVSPAFPSSARRRIGGAWRHVKETLEHGGGRGAFVDGLVRVYDNDKFTEALQPQRPYEGHPQENNALYAPNVSQSQPEASRFPKIETNGYVGRKTPPSDIEASMNELAKYQALNRYT